MNISIFTLACLLSINVSICFAMPFDDSYWGPFNPSSSSSSSTTHALSNSDAHALSLFPRIIQDWCVGKSNNYHAQRLVELGHDIQKGKRCNPWQATHNAKEICDDLNLSPHTFFTVVSTCTAIAKRQPFDHSALAITYDPVTESNHKLALIQQMPKIVADICSKNPDEHYKKMLLACFYSNNPKIVTMIIEHLFYGKTPQKRFTRTINYTIAKILYEEHNNDNYISPHTAVRMAQELRNWVFEKKPVSSDPYNKALEIELCESICKRFPAELKKSYAMHEYHTKKLVGYAFLLENPAEKNVIEYFIEHSGLMSHTNIKYYGDIQYHIKELIKNKTAAYELTDQFIDIFKPASIPLPLPTSTASSHQPSTLVVSAHPAVNVIQTCYNTILKTCCIPDENNRNIILTELVACHTQLLATAESGNLEHQNKLCDERYVKQQLEEAIPTCPICFDRFSDQFNTECNGAKHALTPCSHVVCTECFKNLNSTCPLCRAPIEG